MKALRSARRPNCIANAPAGSTADHVLAATCESQGLVVEADAVEDNPNHAHVVGWPMDDKAACKLIAEEIVLSAAPVQSRRRLARCGVQTRGARPLTSVSTAPLL